MRGKNYLYYAEFLTAMRSRRHFQVPLGNEENCVANMGKFSSEQTIREYANEIWQVTPVDHE